MFELSRRAAEVDAARGMPGAFECPAAPAPCCLRLSAKSAAQTTTALHDNQHTTTRRRASLRTSDSRIVETSAPVFPRACQETQTRSLSATTCGGGRECLRHDMRSWADAT